MTHVEPIVVAAVLALLTAAGLLMALLLRRRQWRLPHAVDYDHHWYQRVIEGRQTRIEFGGATWNIQLYEDLVVLQRPEETASNAVQLHDKRFKSEGSQYRAAVILAHKIQLRRRLLSELRQSADSPSPSRRSSPRSTS